MCDYRYGNSMEKGEIYCLKNFLVRDYQGTRYLTMPQEGADLLIIDDISNVSEEVDQEDEDLPVTISNATIIGVLQLDKNRACLKCKARVEPLSPPLGRCSKSDCLMTQRYDLCPENTSGKLVFMHGSEEYVHFVCIWTDFTRVSKRVFL